MRMKLGAALLGVLATLTFNSIADVQDVTIFLQCSNVVLSWPSQPGETFTVLYRPTLNTNTPWATLTNLLPAAVNTNKTTFVHVGIADCSQPMAGGGGGGGSGEPPPSPSGAQSASSTTLTDEQRVQLYEQLRIQAEETIKYLEQLLLEAITKAEATRQKWQLEGFPSAQTQDTLSAGVSSAESGSGGGTQGTGFYRVFKTSPAANTDYFGIQQDSGANQLGIFNNDFDPDNDAFLLSSLTSAGHGTIQYTLDASVFRYSPDIGFFGTDSFAYTVTNFTEGRATATVNVFVSQSGNTPPTIPQPTITLPTNVYTATLDPLAGASDADSDPISFVAVAAPRLGTVTYNAGQLAYTHPSNYFGADGFDYFLTDGRGGLTRVSVSVLQTDNDNDGMADEWETLFGLDPGAVDSNGDPDSDGLPNLAEYKLGTSPRSAYNPLNLDKITTAQVFSNYARIPLSLNAPIERLPISLMMNGLSANALLQQGADGVWYFDWDTGYLTNGNYSLAASFQFNPDAQPPSPGSTTGQSKSVLVMNEVIFDSLNSGFSAFWTVHLRFPYFPADWRIELYDEDGSGLVYFEGTDTDGEVFGSWDLTDTGQGGQQISFGNILAYVYVAPAGTGLPPLGAQAQADSNRWFTKEVPGGIGDKFVVAWGWDSYSPSFNQQREDLMLNGVINIINSPAAENEYQLLPVGRNGFHCCAFRYDTPADRQVLMDALADTSAGNFFWFGHGEAGAIQGNAKKSSIGDGDVENLLNNKKHRSTPKLSRKNDHPYRLVILNGCKTYSAGWANAFGIDFSPSSTTNIILEYQFTGRSPQAFVAWTDDVIIPVFPDFASAHIQYSNALAELFSRWMGDYPLDICLEFFAETATGYGFENQDKWKISGCRDLRRYDP